MVTAPPRSQIVERDSPMQENLSLDTRLCLVAAYSTCIPHVLAVLLFGKWHPITMLTAASVSSDGAHAAGEDRDDWMSTNHFMKWAFSCGLCLASRGHYYRARPRARFHAVPLRYLFASWQLYPTALRRPYAAIRRPKPRGGSGMRDDYRAHEICVMILSTEFQRSFRRALRGTLHSVRSSGPTDL